MFTAEQNIYIKRFEKFLCLSEKALLPEYVLLNAEFAMSKDIIAFNDAVKLKYTTINEEDKWGVEWEKAWFHFKGKIPTSWNGRAVSANLDLNGEGLVFSKEGTILQGITNNSVMCSSYKIDLVHLTDKCKGGENVELWVDMSANAITGIALNPDARPNDKNRYGTYTGIVKKIRLAIWDQDLYQLRMDTVFLLDLLKILPTSEPRCRRIIRALNEMLNFICDDYSKAAEARLFLKDVMNQKASASALEVYAIGHAHLDTAWLWPVKETIRKCGRTFANQLKLIEKYPRYIFGASQPQHYAFIKEYYPELYSKIKKYIKDGRWELQGGMWVEADCNIISGESIVRQILHGKNFFMDEFGIEVKNLWLPDVFGYSAAMPQILRKSGIDFFLTQKICWSQFNEFPYNTFKWRGIDGTEVVSHFPPENNFNSTLMPSLLAGAERRFKENDFINEFVSMFGMGDGGGGPSEDHIERGLRAADIEGLPRVKFAKAQECFDKLISHKDKLNTWSGELYLEFHRGTYTTQALVKKNNRFLENKLRLVEMIYSCLPLNVYPAEKLDYIWKKLLLNQFHDIIPGSSIRQVYEVTEAEYDECLKKCDKLLQDAATELMEKNHNYITVFNSLGYYFDGLIPLPPDISGVSHNGKDLPVQKDSSGNYAKVYIHPYSFIILEKKTKGNHSILKGSRTVLENDFIRYTFKKDGTIISIYDKEQKREFVKNHEKANMISLYYDNPSQFDAWDIEIFYEKQCVENADCIAVYDTFTGALRSGMTLKFKIGNSEIVQHISLEQGSRRLDFSTEVEWNETHKMLRVAFPLALTANKAFFDIQYGYIERNTHRNTSWDIAKFETVAHKYVDISESDCGVALLNDCKYGYKVFDGILDLCLLRSPTHPDPDADRGYHEFIYSILPHQGSFSESNVILEANLLNRRPQVFDNMKIKNTVRLPCRMISTGISMEVLKKAEKDDCLVIRLVETLGRRSEGELLFDKIGYTLIESDLMEWHNHKSLKCTKKIKIILSPFEIKTFKLCITF